MITDALGGVDVCLKDAVYEPLSGADFPAGWQKLDGPQALSFVRQRHDLPRGDLDRVTRQQAVMAALAHQVISGKTLSSPATLNRLQDAVQRSVVLSDGWDIMDFVTQLQKLAGGNVAFATIPVLRGGRLERRRHAERRPRRRAAVKDWVAGLLKDQDEGKTEVIAYSPDKTTVEVVNDTDINGLAASVSAGVDRQGFRSRRRRQQRGRTRPGSQVQAAKADDLGAASGRQGTRQPPDRRGPVGGPGIGAGGAGGRLHRPRLGPRDRGSVAGRPPTRPPSSPPTLPPPPSPVLTAGSDDPACVS